MFHVHSSSLHFEWMIALCFRVKGNAFKHSRKHTGNLQPRYESGFVMHKQLSLLMFVHTRLRSLYQSLYFALRWFTSPSPWCMSVYICMFLWNESYPRSFMTCTLHSGGASSVLSVWSVLTSSLHFRINNHELLPAGIFSHGADLPLR